MKKIKSYRFNRTLGIVRLNGCGGGGRILDLTGSNGGCGGIATAVSYDISDETF